VSLRTSISLRHAKHEHYTLVSADTAHGTCVIKADDGRQATVKAAWLEKEGADCWPVSTRQAMHIKLVRWE